MVPSAESAAPPVSAGPTEDSHALDVCEGCGYRLTGLPDDGRCPECGLAVSLSTTHSGRVLTPADERGLRGFAATTLRVWRRPGGFFRHLRTRVDDDCRRRATTFGRFHVVIAAAVSTAALLGHWGLVLSDGNPTFGSEPVGLLLMMLMLMFASVAAAAVWIAAVGKCLVLVLTVWEARYWGMRLDGEVAARVLDFHTAHATSVASVALLVIAAAWFAAAAGWLTERNIDVYVIGLAVLAIAAAGWLFWTFRLAMRNVLHANV